MTATKISRRTARRSSHVRKIILAAKASAKTRLGAAPPPQVMYRLCKPGWAVVVEKAPNAQGTRIVCPFCPLSHRVPGPVRGFRKLRRAQWVKLRRVEE